MKWCLLLIFLGEFTSAENIIFKKNELKLADLHKYPCIKYLGRNKKMTFYGKCDILLMIELSTIPPRILNIKSKDWQ